MKPLFILSVAAALFAACGSGDGDENAVTQPETGDIDFLQESSNSLDKGENGENFVTSGSNAIMSSGAVNMSSTTPVASSETRDIDFLRESSSSLGLGGNGCACSSSRSNTSMSSGTVNMSSGNRFVFSDTEFSQGTIMDSRDGRTYKTVTIGSQTWMSENLNYEVENSYCYEDNPAYCKEFGRLYTLDAAKTACPAGWHLPTKDDWWTLFSLMNETYSENALWSLTAKGYEIWPKALDIYGFSIRPSGIKTEYGKYEEIGRIAFFQLNSSSCSNSCKLVCISEECDATFLSNNGPGIALSVRCLKDDIDWYTDGKSSSGDAGVLTDSRDGKVYRTVTIGAQTWMAENLNYKTKESRCYKGSVDSCAKYGRLYSWSATIGACPDGWHLPDKAEWKILYETMYLKKNPYAMQAKGWEEWPEALDLYGFSAIPAGRTKDEAYYAIGTLTRFCSSTEVEGASKSYWLYLERDQASIEESPDKSNCCSIRCLKDGTVTVKKCKSGNCEYGLLTDGRDGQTYKTVKIGEQVWMAENLNYEVENQSSCQFNLPEECLKYGRYYSWAGAVGKSEEECGRGKECGLTGIVRGVCPEGWHLPDTSEWRSLYLAMRENVHEMQAIGWEKWPYALDMYGFSALPAGHYHDGKCSGCVGYTARFWSSLESHTNAYTLGLGRSSASIGKASGAGKAEKYSVRCVQDDP